MPALSQPGRAALRAFDWVTLLRPPGRRSLRINKVFANGRLQGWPARQKQNQGPQRPAVAPRTASPAAQSGGLAIVIPGQGGAGKPAGQGQELLSRLSTACLVGVTSPFAQNCTTRPMHEKIAFERFLKQDFVTANARYCVQAANRPHIYVCERP